jgi:hypothetical protein
VTDWSRLTLNMRAAARAAQLSRASRLHWRQTRDAQTNGKAGVDAMKRAASLTVLSACMAAVKLTCPVEARAARSACSVKSASGTGISAENAKFQVYEGLLKAVDWNAWASWMADGSTPGYAVKPVKYVCHTGSGLGVTCSAKARICKL